MINLNLITTKENIVSCTPVGRSVFTLVNEGNNDGLLKLRRIDLDSNKQFAIEQAANLSPYLEVQNAVWNSGSFYFAVLEEKNGQNMIAVYKIDENTKSCSLFYQFIEETPLTNEHQIKIFVLSESCLLLQREILKEEKSELQMGHLTFKQEIIDLETKETVVIKDENLNNNGLNLIIPISPLKVMTKTGFNYIEDNRLTKGAETEALIESIFIHTTSRFIADLMLGSITIDAQLLTSTYYERYILNPRLKDRYIYYLVADPWKEDSMSNFYHTETEEKFTCKTENQDMTDLDCCFVLAGNPYVKNSALKEVQFLNLKNMEFDLSAMGEDFIAIIGELLILHTKNKHKDDILEFYHYPKMSLIHKEKGTFVKGCKSNDDYLIYLFEK